MFQFTKLQDLGEIPKEVLDFEAKVSHSLQTILSLGVHRNFKWFLQTCCDFDYNREI